MRNLLLLLIFVGCQLHAGWAEDTLVLMSREEKIGQLLMIAVPCNPEATTNVDRLFTLKLPTNLNTNYALAMIRDYHAGGILYICEGTMQEQVIATNNFQRHSATPLLIAQDFEPGLVRLNDVVNYPHARVLGTINDTNLTYRLGKQLGERARRLGVHVVFAPVVDVQTNANNPVINKRSFGTEPDLVAHHGVALMRGLQDVGVIACAKHFPGHGDTSVDSHLGLPVLAHVMERLEHVELVPFKKLIDAGVQSVMSGHLLVPAVDEQNPASLSKIFITKLLQEVLHFKGLVFTDALIMKALPQDGTAALKALLAGSTMAVFPADVPQSFAALELAVERGEFSEQELDKKVLMILQAKERLGLHNNRFVGEQNLPTEVCTPEAVALRQEIEDRLKN